MFQLLSETFENQSGRSRYVRVIWFTDNTIPNSTAKNEMATAYHICVLSWGLINESVAILAQSLQYAAAANCAFAVANSNAHASCLRFRLWLVLVCQSLCASNAPASKTKSRILQMGHNPTESKPLRKCSIVYVRIHKLKKQRAMVSNLSNGVCVCVCVCVCVFNDFQRLYVSIDFT